MPQSFWEVLEDICGNIHGGKIGNILLKVKEKIEPIYKLHCIVKEKLISAADVYLTGRYLSGKKTTNVADVFLELKEQFLAYAPFLDLIANANKAIDLHKLDDAGAKDLERIEKMMMDNAIKTGSSNLPTNINSLLIRPTQTIMR